MGASCCRVFPDAGRKSTGIYIHIEKNRCPEGEFSEGLKSDLGQPNSRDSDNEQENTKNSVPKRTVTINNHSSLGKDVSKFHTPDSPATKQIHVAEPVPKPRSVIYDPKKTHENYLKWSKTRLNGPVLTDGDLPHAVSNISLRIVTPHSSANKDMGRVEEILDERHKMEVSIQPRPKVIPGELWVDNAFTKDTALQGIEGVGWKRPRDICKRPALFCDGTSRYDIGQGSAGTCWFLCILTSLADKPEYISQIIPKDAYTIQSSVYDGVFHCQLWRLGRWHSVYIDDFLPVHAKSGKLWGAHSQTDENELWVALMEKAFAKFHGSYSAVKGGCAGDAFVTLTGGVEEDLHLDSVPPLSLFKRMDNALRCGAILACSVPVEHDGIHGLTGGHAYTINSIAEVPFRGRVCPILRIRNPWGNSSGEWKGAWGDGAPEWKEISMELKDMLGYKEANDGEFWMSLVDFFKYMWRAFVCNFTPDFNDDGCPNGLDKMWGILGEWNSNSTDFPSGLSKFLNPKYTFTISESQHIDINNLEDVPIGMCPLVIQFLQEDVDGEFLYIRCDLYRISKLWEQDGSTHILISEITNDKVYMGAPDMTYRYVLSPGQYIVMPTYSKSKEPVEPRSVEWNETTHVYLSSLKMQTEEAGLNLNMPAVDHWVSQWKLGINSGGQACRSSYHINPHYEIHIPTGSGQCQLGVCLSQELCQPIVPLGIEVYKVSDNMTVPFDEPALLGGVGKCIDTVNGTSVFIRGYSAVGYYLVAPGRYVILLFSNEITDEKRFTLSLASDQPVTCRPHQDCTSLENIDPGLMHDI